MCVVSKKYPSRKYCSNPPLLGQKAIPTKCSYGPFDWFWETDIRSQENRTEPERRLKAGRGDIKTSQHVLCERGELMAKPDHFFPEDCGDIVKFAEIPSLSCVYLWVVNHCRSKVAETGHFSWLNSSIVGQKIGSFHFHNQNDVNTFN